MDTSQPTPIPDFIVAANELKQAFDRHRLPNNLEDAHKMIKDLERRLSDVGGVYRAATLENRKLTKQRDAARRLAAKHRRRARKLEDASI